MRKREKESAVSTVTERRRAGYMSGNAPAADTSTSATPDLSLLAREGGGGAKNNTKKKKGRSSRSSRGSTQEEKEEAARGGSSEWWEPLFCCGTSPSGEFRTAGYDGGDTDSDEEDDSERAEFHRCDVCGCRALSRGCLVSLCCQEPRRPKSVEHFDLDDEPAAWSCKDAAPKEQPPAYVDPEPSP